MASIQKISPFLMFDGPVEEAAKFYVSVFPNSAIKSANPMSATIVANGTEILRINGGPRFKFTPGISLFVKCKDQAEVDLCWNKFLSNGGREDNCRWLQDKWASPGRSSPMRWVAISPIRIAKKPTAPAGDAEDEEDRRRRPRNGLQRLTSPKRKP
jgi:uncharacterized glyoxalase superfamily protein PhnB